MLVGSAAHSNPCAPQTDRRLPPPSAVLDRMHERHRGVVAPSRLGANRHLHRNAAARSSLIPHESTNQHLLSPVAYGCGVG